MLLALAAALAYLPLAQVLLLAGGATAVVLLVRWPWLIWLALAAALPVTSGLKAGVVSASDVLFAAAIALWFFDGARRRTLPLKGSPVLAAAAIYLAVLTVSSLGAANLGEAFAEVVKWSELVVLLLVAPSMLTVARARWVAAALVLAGIGQAALGVYQFVFRIGPEFFVILGRFMRASGSFSQPNPFGGFLGLTLPIALSLAIWAWGEFLRGQGGRRAPLGWSLFYTTATGVIVAGLLASWSRGAWLGAAVGVMIVLVLRSRTAAMLTGVAALLVLGVILLGAFSPEVIPEPVAARMQDIPAYFGLTDVLSEPLTDDNFSVVERVAHWVAAQRMWELAPWLGVGPGNYAVRYAEVRLPKWEEPLGHAHNIYLNVLGETGLVGLAAYVALLVTVIVWTWRRLREAAGQASADSRWYAALAVGVLGVMGHLCVHNTVDNLFVQGMVLQIGLWLALLHVPFAHQAPHLRHR